MKSQTLMENDTLCVLSGTEEQDYPVSVRKQAAGKEGCSAARHQHGGVQFSLVTQGNVVFRVDGQAYSLCRGQGIFIGSGHPCEVFCGDGSNGAYLCIEFMPQLLYSQLGSLIYNKYFEPILNSGRMQALPLLEEPWQKEACRNLAELAELYEQAPDGFELLINARLMGIWLLIYRNSDAGKRKSVPLSYADKQRISELHRFIQENYADKITLDDIAASVHISRGECCRIFKRLHHMTPFQYLIRFRLLQSIRLLSESNSSISQIAQQVGFGSSSYFTECFKRELHCPPHKYRQRLNSIAAAPDAWDILQSGTAAVPPDSFAAV